MMIYAQRPNATACAEYDFWNEKMRRYVMRGSKGIALIDTRGDKARLRYVFDVADTAELENARRPQLWQYRPEHQADVAAALETRYGASGKYGFATQIELVSSLLAQTYWDENQEDLLRIVDGSVLEEYDKDDIREKFQNAAFISIAYTIMSRCGLEPESYFTHEDFMDIFDFSTIPSATALGMAVSQSSEQVLRQIEVTIRAFEREKRKERSESHGEQIDVQPERGLLDSEPDIGGSAVPAPGQIRENAAEISEGEPPDLVGGADGEREAVLPPAGNREDGQREAGPDDARIGEIGGGNGEPESQRSDEVGGSDEHLQGPGGGNDPGGAGVQLNSGQEGQISLFPSERQQIEAIQEAESVEAPSAPSISEGDIDNLLRQGTGFQDGKLRIYEQYQKGISKGDAVKLLKKEYGTGGGSYTFLDGTSGFADYRPAKGFVFWWTPKGAEITVSWAKVEKRLRQLIQEGNYLTPEELESYRADHQERLQTAKDITDMDIDKLLVEDFGITGRKQRIFALFQQGLSDQQIADHLRDEYNRHGYTAEERAHEGPCVLADGGMGYGYFVTAEWRLRRRDVDGPMRYVKYEEMARHIRTLIDQGRYLTPEQLAQITSVPEPVAPEPDIPKPEPAAHSEVTQADIDAALQEWNGDAASKRRVQQYMIDHAREKDTAAWLRNEYGDDFPAFPVNGAHSGTDLSWTKVQRHLARLVKEDRFFTEDELENFDDIDADAVREQLQQGRPSAFVEQVKTDVERLTEAKQPTVTVRESYEHYKPIVKERVLADQAYQNACINSDRETALMEGHMAVERAARSFVDAEDMPFTRLYFDMAEFRSRLHREILDETYPILSQPQQEEGVHESGVPSSDAELETVPGVIGAADQPSRDPLAPAYQVGDTVYLEKKPYVIADIYPSSVSLQDVSQTYPVFRSENKDQFESVLILDSRNRPITEFLPANVETCDQDMREVADSHLLTDRDKHYISGWFRGSKGNSDVAHLLSELFANCAETVELATGEKADYFTSTTSLEINILDDDGNKKAAVTGFWSEVAALLRGLWLQELDGFAHEPPPLEPAHLEGTPSYAVGDHVVFPTHDRDVSGTIEYIGEFDVRIDTGPYVWSHQTVNKDFFENALRQDERNAGLFVRETPVQETPAEAAPAVPAAGNFRITDDNLGVGGARVKYRMNVEAIRTLKQIEMEGRSATAEEQEILSHYVGWGGVPDAFDKNKADWLHEYDELKELLTPEEYKSAMASTLNAHYTSPMVIKAIYEAVGNMGFEAGNILEPSCGVGNFFGLLPESMSGSKLFGVELDSITGRIAQQLYPEAHIVIKGFEKTNFPDGFFDIAVGNVPFGNYKLVDQRYDRQNFLIHDYFFAKTIDKVRPGGVIAFITSNGVSGGTMDKKDDRARRYMARRCDLLGAVRLPDGTFQANAGTDTSMSILFLQKREVPLRENDPLPDWVTASVIESHTYIGSDGAEHPGFVSMNRYFQAHPEMVLGELKITSGPFGPQLECRPQKGADLAQQLREALSHIHGEITRVEAPELDGEPAEDMELPADADVKEGSYAVIGGEVYYREDSKMVRPELSAAAKGRVTGMVELRDCVHRLIDLQMRDSDEAAIVEEREQLNRLYDAFTAKGAGYMRWASAFNLKQMAQTLNYLTEHKLLDYADLSQKVAEASAGYNDLSGKIKAAEQRMAEIAVLKTHIINYAKTREIYAAYRKAGYSKAFKAEHESEILLHQAAKKAFDDLGLKKLPTVKELQAEYAALLAEKKSAYVDYRRARDQMKELLTVKANVDRLMGYDKAEPEKDTGLRKEH